MLEPKGELATKLIDELQAHEAYYRFDGYTSHNVNEGIQKSVGRSADFAAAPAAPMPAEASPDDDESLDITQDNVPLYENAVHTVYTVRYRARHNLVEILNGSVPLQSVLPDRK